MATTERLYSIHDAQQELGTYRRLIRHLIAVHDIPTHRVGNAIVLDADGFARLSEVFNAWQKRPRIAPSDGRKLTPSSG